MIFGSYKSEWSDRLARALAKIGCEKPLEPTHGEFVNCGEHPLTETPCDPCSARKYVERYPEDSTS